MKYYLLILVFLCNFCYGQKDTTKWDIKSNTFEDDVFFTSTHIQHSRDSVISTYDTSFGFIEIITNSGGLIRGLGVKIDSLDIGYHYHGFPSKGYFLDTKNGHGNGYDFIIQGNFIDTIKTTLKIYFDACDCLLDVKKWFNFIPIGMAQSFTIYEDEHISISPNENYKKDEK